MLEAKWPQHPVLALPSLASHVSTEVLMVMLVHLIYSVISSYTLPFFSMETQSALHPFLSLHSVLLTTLWDRLVCVCVCYWSKDIQQATMAEQEFEPNTLTMTPRWLSSDSAMYSSSTLICHVPSAMAQLCTGVGWGDKELKWCWVFSWRQNSISLDYLGWAMSRFSTRKLCPLPHPIPS